MAIVTLNKTFATFSGSVGDLSYFMRNGKLIARRKPQKTAKRTRGQKAQQRRISEAAAYWRSVKADPAKLAAYTGLPQVPGLGPYHFAIRDFMNPPVVEEIDVSRYSGQTGERIGIKATDDTEVVEVAVQILDMAEAVLEEGAAHRDEANTTWSYVSVKSVSTGQTVSVRVTAKDRPGNSASKSILAYVR